MNELTHSLDFRDGSADLLRFLVTGDAGAVQLVIRTHWSAVVKAAQDPSHWRDTREAAHLMCHPLAMDVGYHSRAKVEWATEFDDCDVLGGPCWYDGSGLAAEDLFRAFADQGADAVWAYLDDYYRERFGTEDAA